MIEHLELFLLPMALAIGTIVALWQQSRFLKRQVAELSSENSKLKNKSRLLTAHREVLKGVIRENAILFLTSPDEAIRDYAKLTQKNKCKCAYCAGDSLAKKYYHSIVFNNRDLDLNS